MSCKGFSHYRSFIRETRWSPMDFMLKGPIMRSFGLFSGVCINKLLKKESRYLRFDAHLTFLWPPGNGIQRRKILKCFLRFYKQKSAVIYKVIHLKYPEQTQPIIQWQARLELVFIQSNGGQWISSTMPLSLVVESGRTYLNTRTEYKSFINRNTGILEKLPVCNWKLASRE